jgi:hypothetical protein
MGSLLSIWNGLPAWLQWLLGIAASGLGSLGVYLVKTAWDKVVKAFATLEKIHTIQGTQAENHLQTIQANTACLPQMAADTTAMKNELTEFLGYIKAKAEDGKI